MDTKDQSLVVTYCVRIYNTLIVIYHGLRLHKDKVLYPSEPMYLNKRESKLADGANLYFNQKRRWMGGR